MNWIAQAWWPLFAALFLLLLLTSLWMSKLATHFNLSPQRVLSIFDLELPPSEKSFVSLLKDINGNDVARRKLKQHLWVDFLFMPAAYLCIALLCFRAGMKMSSVGKWLFLFLAAAQVVAWLLDAIENRYLLGKLKNPSAVIPKSGTEKSSGFAFFQTIVKTKFAIAFTGTACSVFGLLYYWIMGQYQKESLYWLAGWIAVIVVFFVIGKPAKKPLLTGG